MSIRVTCTGCHTRFSVSKKFAGKDGPCPRCKKTITIPASSEAVEVHAPKNLGPTTTSGQAVFKPIQRQDTRLSPVQIVLIGATIFGFVAIAFIIRTSIADKDTFRSWVLLVASIVLAFPCVYAAYAFLRNADLGAFQGQELWTRVGACAVVYGVAWLAIPLVSYAVDPEIGTFIGTGLMIAIGATSAWLLFGLDVFVGILHYGLFLGSCILLRVIAGFSPLPVAESSSSKIDDILNAPEGASVYLDLAVDFCQFMV